MTSSAFRIVRFSLLSALVLSCGDGTAPGTAGAPTAQAGTASVAGGTSTGAPSSAGAAATGTGVGGNGSATGTPVAGGSATGSAGGAESSSGGSASGGSTIGGGSSMAGSTAAASNVPDATSMAVSAYLAAASYTEDTWQSETAAPRERSLETSPHGRVRVWYNDTLAASTAAGKGQWDEEARAIGTPHDSGSMAVKEFYDETDTLIGIATMLKIDGTASQWAYYCEGPSDRCGAEAGVEHTSANPLFGTGALFSPCGFCHGGLIFTEF